MADKLNKLLSSHIRQDIRQNAEAKPRLGGVMYADATSDPRQQLQSDRAASVAIHKTL